MCVTLSQLSLGRTLPRMPQSPSRKHGGRFVDTCASQHARRANSAWISGVGGGYWHKFRLAAQESLDPYVFEFKSDRVAQPAG